MTSTVGVVLTTVGEVRNAKIAIANAAVGCQITDIHKYLKRKQMPSLLGTYSWKELTLYLFGYKEGKQEVANKHDLPPPLEGQTFYGDILVLAATEKGDYSHPKRFKPDDYELFYNHMISGDADDEGDEVENEEEDAAESDDGSSSEESEESEEEETAPIDEEESVEEDEALDEEEKEEDEDAPVVVAPLPKPKSSRSKRKEATPMVFAPTAAVIEKELEPETTPHLPDNLHRGLIIQSLRILSSSLLTMDQQIELEHHIFNASLKIAEKRHITKHWSQPLFVDIYTMHARSIIGNLLPHSYIQNSYLFKRLQSGELTIKEIASFGFSDLYPDIWKELSLNQFEREKRQLEGNKSMATDQFQCKRCWKRECIYYELQTRSADEPMTIFIQCLNCGKHWRQ